jgi:arabinoxylan arabinofuranohydrolase
MYVTAVDNNDIKVRGVQFNKAAKSFELSVATSSAGGTIEIHADNLEGKLLGSCNIGSTGGWNKWLTKTCKVQQVKGLHDIYFVFKGANGQLFNIDWWKFR